MPQSLHEYRLDNVPGAPGLLADTNFRPNFIYRTLSGGQTRQTVAPIAIGGTIATETFTVTVPLTFADGSTFTATAVVVATANLNTAALIEGRLAIALQSIPEFDRVAIADASSGDLVIQAKQFGVNPIGAVTTSITGGPPTGGPTITATPAVTNFTNAAAIPLGFVVGATATDSDRECRLFSTGASILGIATIYQQGEQGYPPSNLPLSAVRPSDQYRQGEMVRILAFGGKGQRIWVPTPDTITKFATPNINNTTGQIQGAGGAGTTALTGARFVSDRVNGLVIVEL